MSSVKDIIVIAIILFAVGITTIFAVNIGHRVNTNLLVVPAMNNSVEATSVIQHTDTAIDMMDYVYFAFFVGFFISLIIFGWLVGGLPIFAPIYFFLVIIFTFVSVILQLVWNDISLNPELTLAVVNMPLTTFILSHLGLFTAVFGLAAIAAMFAKSNSTGGAY
jgi:hypothetical protein